MGSVFLASKLLETPKRVREVVNVFHYLQNALYNKCPSEALLVDYKEVVLEYVGEGYYDLRDRATFAENVILRELGFHLEFYLPYGLLINYCQVLQLLIPDEPSLNTQEKPREATHKSHHKQEDLKITQKALGYLNDSFYTPVHMLFQPNVLACAVISLACQDEELNLLPLHPPWYHVFDTFERGNISSTYSIIVYF